MSSVYRANYIRDRARGRGRGEGRGEGGGGEGRRGDGDISCGEGQDRLAEKCLPWTESAGKMCQDNFGGRGQNQWLLST